MIYFSGTLIPQRHERLGLMITPESWRKIPDGMILAADNCCFTKPRDYSDSRYENFLRRLPGSRTLFAPAPDVLGDHGKTVARAVPMLRRIRELGHKAAFVAQDGWSETTTPWDEFDTLFVGGSTEFKFRGGRAAVAAAKRRNKMAHMGRVNSLRRFRAAQAIGCDSVDGNFLTFAPQTNWARMLVWFDALETQPGFAL